MNTVCKECKFHMFCKDKSIDFEKCSKKIFEPDDFLKITLRGILNMGINVNIFCALDYRDNYFINIKFDSDKLNEQYEEIIKREFKRRFPDQQIYFKESREIEPYAIIFEGDNK